MGRKEEFKAYREQMSIAVREEKVLEAVQKSKEIFIGCEQMQTLGYLEFLMTQFRQIRKKWWLLQSFLLSITMLVLPYVSEKKSAIRILGVIGVLFVVLIIPEFWKNRSYGCMQVEGTCLYSLRQIYAARMLLFGIVDVFILTCFCSILQGTFGITIETVLTQFVFPMLVAACICFATLCSKHLVNEAAAMFLCLAWSVVWSVIVLNEAMYNAITFPIWSVLFTVVLLFFAGAVYKTIYQCNQYWEVNFGGITID